MILNGRKISEHEILQTQICIIGTGAAGVTLSLELARQGFHVMLLEAGDLQARSYPDDDLKGFLVEPLPKPCRPASAIGSSAAHFLRLRLEAHAGIPTIGRL